METERDFELQLGSEEKKDKNAGKEEREKTRLKKKCWILLSCLVSMAGGFLLIWWIYKHHPTNTQLWMVPAGLLLLVTPVIIWFPVFFSNTCNSDPPVGQPER